MTRVELYTNFSRNIEIERDRLGLSQQKMADALGISLSKYKILITNPYESNVDIYLAHQIYNVTGKTTRELCEDNIPELEMIKLLRRLPKHRRDAIKYIVETESQLPRDGIDPVVEVITPEVTGKRIKDDDCTTCFIVTGNMEDGMILDSRDMISIDVSEYKKYCSEHIDCAIKITSNHLHPIYMKGDYLLISKRAPRDGDIGIFILKETRQMYIREFKQTQPCELRPINEYGSTIYVDSNDPSDMARWIKFGTVLTTMR